MSDKTATERLRELLDERGVEWRKWTKGQVRTLWFVPDGMTEYGSYFCVAKVTKDHREGPLHYSGYVVSPEAAIEASLGKLDSASASNKGVDNLNRLVDANALALNHKEVNVKALDALRDELKVCGCDPDECMPCSVPRKVRDGFDEVEREIAERFMPRPMDADGVPIESRRMMACGTCGCFVDEERTDMHTPYDGECRLEPPKIVPLGDGELCCFFPMVNKEDWCRQWIERNDR